jgi:hypothetical protein
MQLISGTTAGARNREAARERGRPAGMPTL